MLPPLLQSLRIPVIASPMLIASYPELVLAQCKAGIVGAFPALNARPPEALGDWLAQLDEALAAHRMAYPLAPTAPYAVNQICHPSNARLEADMRVCLDRHVPLLITSLLAPPREIVDEVHRYGGLILHDVTTVRHAQKALEAGVDGLILVAAGAGGHAGTLSPFALVSEVRRMHQGPLVLAGAISNGYAVAAAITMGADAAYIGTRFLASQEANVAPRYKETIVQAQAADIVYTDAFSGVPGNYLRQSIEAAGFDPRDLPRAADAAIDFSGDNGTRQWRDIWGAGQGVGSIDAVMRTADIVDTLEHEFLAACRQVSRMPAMQSKADSLLDVSSSHAIAGSTRWRIAFSELPSPVAFLGPGGSYTEEALRTRFLVLGGPPTPPSGHDRTSLVMRLAHSVGTLASVFEAIARCNVDVLWLESRPLRGETWAYWFFVDLAGHADEPHVAAALDALASLTEELHVLGSYVRSEEDPIAQTLREEKEALSC